MKIISYIKNLLLIVGVLVLIIFSTYLLTGSEGKANKPIDETSDNFLTNHIHDWEVGDWWVVEQVTNDSVISGVPGQLNTKQVKYEVMSKNIDPKKKELKNDNSVITYYVVRESYIGINDTYKDLFYMAKNKKNKVLYKSDTHYVLRDENTIDEEYYNIDDITATVVTPLIAREMEGANKKYDKKASSYLKERGAKKHVSGLNFGELSKGIVYDDNSTSLLQLTHDSTPWPIYEKTSFIESELLDYSGWHELSEEALTRIPQSHKEKVKTNSKKFLSRNDE
jgi:hypothetical protein